MYSDSIVTRILWLSDIHLSHKYPGKNNLEKELDDFFQSLFGKIANEDLDYILLSGDIAFSGSIEDYKYFEKLFFKRLAISRHKGAKLLVVPGNHDILRSTSNKLIRTVQNNGKEVYKDRSDYLVNDNKAEYLESFRDYTAFFNSRSIQKYFPKQGSNDTYSEHRLFGYHVDEQNKLIFILLNSAWFSLGNNFSTLMKDQFMKDEIISRNTDAGHVRLENVILGEKIEALLRTKDNITEYGTQVIGHKLLEELDLMEVLLRTYSDFTVLTVVHHPPNWLHWLEKYNYKEEERERNVFHRILDSSNFLLTGHEHVPPAQNKELYENDVHHLKGGCLLDELKDKVNLADLNYNRFSILEINNRTNNWLMERIIRYDPEKIKDQLIHKWVEEPLKGPIFYSYKYLAKPDNTNDGEFNLSRHLNTVQSKGLIKPKRVKVTADHFIYKFKSSFYIISGRPEGIKKIISVAFIKRLLPKPNFIRNNKTTVYFILKDTHCKPGIYNDLNSEDLVEMRTNRPGKFHNFYLEYNLKFDAFRNLFFKTLENDDSFELDVIMNINLICEILPYWYFESNKKQGL